MTTHPTSGAADLPEALTADQWLDLAIRHANKDWNSAQPDGYANAVKALCADFAALTAQDPSQPGGFDAGDMAAQGAEQFRAGQASTQPVEKWSDRVQRAHPKSEPEFWPDELRLKYMAEEIADLRTAQPDAQVERLKQEIARLEDAARESEYLRGYRQGYEQRDAEVRGALV